MIELRVLEHRAYPGLSEWAPHSQQVSVRGGQEVREERRCITVGLKVEGRPQAQEYRCL